MNPHDDNMYLLDIKDLHREILRLRSAIRQHRDLKGHDRCWMNDAQLYSTLPEGTAPAITLPPRDEFLENCAYYWKERQCPGEIRTHSSLTRRLAFFIAKRAGIV